MNEEEFGAKIRNQLNHGLRDLDPLVIGRLRAQRHALLAQCQEVEQSQFIWAGMSSSWRHNGVGRWSLGAVMLVFSLVFCGLWWQAWQQERLAEANGLLDAKLLSAEIPPQDFAQQDFSEWLRQGH